MQTRGEERTGESCTYMTNKALDAKKTRIIKRGKGTNPANRSPSWMKSPLASLDQDLRTTSSLSCRGDAAADRTILKTPMCAEGPWMSTQQAPLATRHIYSSNKT